jgi:sporulation protein YlmC with PRC-barrel domain
VSRLLPALALLLASSTAAQPVTDLLGRSVETRDGEQLGQVRDLAVDLDDGRIDFVVISVGSFLIEDSLIAVAADALRASADPDGRLVLEASADSLRRARRFGPGSYPDAPDVVREAAGDAAPDDLSAADDDTATRRGSATISDGRRLATLSAGERSIREVAPPPSRADATPAKPAPIAPAQDSAAPRDRFERLDRNRDGRLDRAEIAHELSRDDRFGDIDLDGNGFIDRDEFERFQP